MRTFSLYLLFLIIVGLILSFAFLPQRRPPPTLIVREPQPEPVRRLTLNPWIQTPFQTSSMEKPAYDLRDGLTF